MFWKPKQAGALKRTKFVTLIKVFGSKMLKFVIIRTLLKTKPMPNTFLRPNWPVHLVRIKKMICVGKFAKRLFLEAKRP